MVNTVCSSLATRFLLLPFFPRRRLRRGSSSCVFFFHLFCLGSLRWNDWELWLRVTLIIPEPLSQIILSWSFLWSLVYPSTSRQLFIVVIAVLGFYMIYDTIISATPFLTELALYLITGLWSFDLTPILAYPSASLLWHLVLTWTFSHRVWLASRLRAFHSFLFDGLSH